MSRDEFIQWLNESIFALKSANINKDIYWIDDVCGCHEIEVLKDENIVSWEDIDNGDSGNFTYEGFISFWKDLENEIGVSL